MRHSGDSTKFQQKWALPLNQAYPSYPFPPIDRLRYCLKQVLQRIHWSNKTVINIAKSQYNEFFPKPLSFLVYNNITNPNIAKWLYVLTIFGCVVLIELQLIWKKLIKRTNTTITRNNRSISLDHMLLGQHPVPNSNSTFQLIFYDSHTPFQVNLFPFSSFPKRFIMVIYNITW